MLIVTPGAIRNIDIPARLKTVIWIMLGLPVLSGNTSLLSKLLRLVNVTCVMSSLYGAVPKG